MFWLPGGSGIATARPRPHCGEAEQADRDGYPHEARRRGPLEEIRRISG